MERKSIWELAKEYPHAKFECFDHNGFEIKNVFVHDKMERYEVKNFHHEQDGDVDVLSLYGVQQRGDLPVGSRRTFRQ